MADGTGVKTHGTSRLCFPAIPFLLEPLPTWKETVGTQNIEVADLTYNDTCQTGGIRAALDIIDSLGLSYTNNLAPVAFMLRSGEAVDAINNFIASGRNATQAEAGGYVICGLMQLGGVCSAQLNPSAPRCG